MTPPCPPINRYVPFLKKRPVELAPTKQNQEQPNHTCKQWTTQNARPSAQTNGQLKHEIVPNDFCCGRGDESSYLLGSEAGPSQKAYRGRRQGFTAIQAISITISTVARCFNFQGNSPGDSGFGRAPVFPSTPSPLPPPVFPDSR